MFKFTINGKNVGSEDLAKEMMRAASASVVQELRERISSIRHPDTGEFPMVIIDGDSLDDMMLRIEGSKALLEIVKTRLSLEELKSMTFVATDATEIPQAFLSYAWEDRELAKKIAEGLQANGIETWWAEWEIGSGDSIRRKIDAGLGNCTHFIVLLTLSSITKPWVNEEIDAGFIRKINAKSRFIPLRHGVAPDALPPLMSGLLSPEIDNDASGLKQLIDDIHGLSRKPALGPAPAAAASQNTGYSPAATAVAGLLVKLSQNGRFMDPQLTINQVADQTELSEDDLTDALYELRHHVDARFDRVLPKDKLYAEFDQFWQPWNPAEDALKLAADLVNNDNFPTDPDKIAKQYGWTARRLNPAMTYLHERDAVHIFEACGSGPYITVRIRKTDATRRFVKSRS